MRRLTLSGMLLLTITSSTEAQFSPPKQMHATLSSVKWDKANNNPFTISGNTITLQLPAASQIYSDIGLEYLGTYNTSAGTYHPMVPVQTSNPNMVFCWEIEAGNVPSNKKEDGICRIRAADAKTITSEQTYTVTIAGNAGNKTLTVKVIPYTGANYVADPLTVVTTGNRPNDLITFRVKLMSPVASGQSQVVAWGLTPNECFSLAKPGAAYNTRWTLNSPNTITFGAGEQQRDITVRIANNVKCVGSNNKFETWHPMNTSMMTAPTYRLLFFNINPAIP